ncbi:hypothetical protein NPIL_335491 [Nephila pilipes]|uniref:Uncharacterized protein n=1 Tax=Nephila pilipes TaxID=299642 RepID=A0A8X6P473_NEPPI|nr:hypothetical protein NPIL_335491 [Nephila pilipes]
MGTEGRWKGDGRLRLSSVLIFFSVVLSFFEQEEKRVEVERVFFCLREYRLRECVGVCLCWTWKNKSISLEVDVPSPFYPWGWLKWELKFLQGTSKKYR